MYQDTGLKYIPETIMHTKDHAPGEIGEIGEKGDMLSSFLLHLLLSTRRGSLD